jgi:hypothetical protein
MHVELPFFCVSCRRILTCAHAMVTGSGMQRFGPLHPLSHLLFKYQDFSDSASMMPA